MRFYFVSVYNFHSYPSRFEVPRVCAKKFAKERLQVLNPCADTLVSFRQVHHGAYT